MNKNLVIIGAVLLVLVVIIFSNSNSDVEKMTSEDNKEVATNTEDTSEINHHLHDGEISVNAGSMTGDLNAMGLMPLEGENGAVGYGLITDKGTDAVIVATTHGGVLDSEVQKDASDPVWHNHVVKLGEVAMCGENPGVIDITFESPGEVVVKENGLVMANVPAEFSGTHSLNNTKISFAPGTDIQKLVQFHLEPLFSANDELQAVCVTKIEEIPFEVI